MRTWHSSAYCDWFFHFDRFFNAPKIFFWYKSFICIYQILGILHHKNSLTYESLQFLHFVVFGFSQSKHGKHGNFQIWRRLPKAEWFQKLQNSTIRYTIQQNSLRCQKRTKSSHNHVHRNTMASFENYQRKYLTPLASEPTKYSCICKPEKYIVYLSNKILLATSQMSTVTKSLFLFSKAGFSV